MTSAKTSLKGGSPALRRRSRSSAAGSSAAKSYAVLRWDDDGPTQRDFDMEFMRVRAGNTIKHRRKNGSAG